MSLILSALALTIAAPGQAAPAPATTTPAPDPTRLAIAQKVVAKLVPQGVYLRMMRDAYPQMMDAMIAQMSGLSAEDLGEEGKGKTLEQAAAEKDPAFRERMRILTRVMGEEMGKVMDKLEPRVRTAVGKAFARRFTLQQLTDMDVFFATPSGAAFAKDYLLTFMDPEMMQEMSAATPEIMRAMPAIMARVEKETAHLPPAPKPEAPEPKGRRQVIARAFVLALALGAAPLAAVPSPVRPSQAAPSPDFAIDAILAITLPTDRVVADSLASFEQQFTSAFARGVGPQLEARYPGATKAIVADIRTQVEPLFRVEMIRQMRGALSDYYRRTFTAPELRQLAEFYATPTGRKLVGNVQAAGSAAAMGSPAKSLEDLGPALDNVMAKGMANATQAMSAADIAVLSKFSATPAARKANDTLPELRKLTVDTMREFIRANQPRIGEIVQATMQRQTGRLQAGKSDKQD